MKNLVVLLICAFFAAGAMAANKTPEEDAATMKAAKDKSKVPSAPSAAPSAAPAQATPGMKDVKGNKTPAEDAATMKAAKDKANNCVPKPDCLKKPPKG